MAYVKVSFWLLPAEADRICFQETINTLAHVYDAPVFTPHVTIYSGVGTVDEDPEAIVAQATQGVQGFSLHVDRLLYTEEFTKTVFVQMFPSMILSTMAEKIRRCCLRPSGYVLNPHLSLIYKRMSEKEKQRIVATVRLERSTVFFDEVRAIATSDTTQTRADVESWEVIYTKKLLT